MTILISTDLVSLLLRLAVGSAMVVHSLPKVKEGWGKQAGQWIGSMGIPPFAATAVTILEFAGGILLIAGLLVPLVAAFLAIQFLSIIGMKVSKMKATFIGTGGKPSYEVDFTYLLLSLSILFMGAGAYSLDALVGV